MKVAVIADALDNQYAGIREYTLQLLRGLALVAPQHDIIAVRAGTGGLPSNVHEISIPFLRLPLAQIYRLGWQLPRQLTRMRVDAVIEPRHVGPFNLPRQIKRATVIHDISWWKYPQFHPFFNAQLQRIVVPRVLKRTDLVITNSRFTTSEVVNHFPFCAERMCTAHIGRPDDFSPRQDKTLFLRLPIRQPYILFVSTLEPRKNLIHLLDAYRLFRERSPTSMPLVLAGKEGWGNGPFQKAREQHPFREDIIHLGYVTRTDLRSLYTHASMFIYPSLYEGFGIPLLEAFSCETPVITSSRSSLPEVAGQAALYVDPERPKDSADCMLKIAQNPELRRHLVEQGKKQLQQYSWTQTASTILKALETLPVSAR